MDVILSGTRVGPTGRAYGVDFLDEMLATAQENAEAAGVHNVEFLAGHIEDLPLPDDSVDVVISNCVINLAPDKDPVFAEMTRVLRPGGRIAISDVVVARDELSEASEFSADAWSECGLGGLTVDEYDSLLASVGFTSIAVAITHTVGPGMFAAAVTASLPAKMLEELADSGDQP